MVPTLAKVLSQTPHERVQNRFSQMSLSSRIAEINMLKLGNCDAVSFVWIVISKNPKQLSKRDQWVCRNKRKGVAKSQVLNPLLNAAFPVSVPCFSHV